MRKIIPLWVAFLGLSLWVSCGKSDKSEVSRAAETYYNYLIEGKYEDYIHSIAYSDSMTESIAARWLILWPSMPPVRKNVGEGWFPSGH